MSGEFKDLTNNHSLRNGAHTSRHRESITLTRMPTSDEVASFLAQYMPGRDVDSRQLLATDICAMIECWQPPSATAESIVLPVAEGSWQPQQRY